jgi:hypothetical protein
LIDDRPVIEDTKRGYEVMSSRDVAVEIQLPPPPPDALMVTLPRPFVGESVMFVPAINDVTPPLPPAALIVTIPFP